MAEDQIQTSDKRIGWFGRASNVINLLMMLFTFGAVSAAFWQGGISREVAKRQLRAYVFMDEGSLSWDTLTPTAVITMKFRNAGQTPAYNAFLTSSYMFDNADLQGAVPVADGQEITRSLEVAPDSIASTSISINVPPSEVQGLLNGDRRLYLSTRLEYDDAFKEHHATTTRQRFNGGRVVDKPTFTTEGLGSRSD